MEREEVVDRLGPPAQPDGEMLEWRFVDPDGQRVGCTVRLDGEVVVEVRSNLLLSAAGRVRAGSTRKQVRRVVGEEPDAEGYGRRGGYEIFLAPVENHDLTVATVTHYRKEDNSWKLVNGSMALLPAGDALEELQEQLDSFIG